MIPIGIVAVAGVVAKTIPAPTISTTNFNAYTNNITISAPVGIPVSSYILESSTSASGPWTSVYQGASASYQHTGLTQTTTYFYRARYSKGSLTSYNGNVFSRATRTSSAKSAIYTSSTNFVKPVGVTSISYLMIGAGGKGGNSYWNNPSGDYMIAGGGGGAGQLITSQSYSVPQAQTTYPITAGVASNTTFIGQTAIKGADGSSNNSGSSGANGGGGGGTIQNDFGQTTWSPGSSTIGGYSGGIGYANDNANIACGGGGGGTGGVGGNYNAVFYFGGSGGSGTTVSLNGNSYTVGSGGSGGASIYDQLGSNQSNSTGYGNGGNAANAGNAGKGTTYTGGNGSTGAVIVSWLD